MLLTVILLLAVAMSLESSVAAASQVPAITSVIEEEGFETASDFINLWKHHFRIQPAQPSTPAAPKTIIVPENFLLSNVVPMDVGNPLYGNTGLRTSFLLDSMVDIVIAADDAQISEQDGLNVKNLNNNNLNFKQINSGEMIINGVRVQDIKTLSDGTVIYVLDRFIFGYDDRIKGAFREQQRRVPGGASPFGGRPVPVPLREH